MTKEDFLNNTEDGSLVIYNHFSYIFKRDADGVPMLNAMDNDDSSFRASAIDMKDLIEIYSMKKTYTSDETFDYVGFLNS